MTLIPRGVVVAGLGRRFLAAVVDLAPVAVVIVLTAIVLRSGVAPSVVLVTVIGAGVLLAGYGLYQWWAYGSRGAGLGALATGCRLLSLRDGEPIGWWRFFLRQLVFFALMGTVVGGIALLVFLVVQERRQGWHDLVAGAVLVQPKRVEAGAPAQPRKAAGVSTVGLPPHLASTFSPQPGTSSSWAPEPPSGSAWNPGPPQSAPAAQAPGPNPPFASGGGQPSGQPWHPPTRQPTPLPGPTGGPQPWVPPSAASEPQEALPRPLPEPTPSPVPAWIPIPSASSVIEPSRKVRVRQREFGEVEDNDGTRIASLPPTGTGRPGDEGWYVRLDDGREVDLAVSVLLGRNPHKTPDDPEEVHLVPASGDGRMISRTHVLIGTDLRGVFVVDRGSTNGTALVGTGGSLEPCPAGTQVRVREGQQVSYGNRWFTVLRRPAPID